MKLSMKRLSEEAKLPSYAHLGDAGMDLYSSEECTLKPGERLIQPVVSANIVESESLDETSRNEGGFGSTGTH